MASNNDQAQKNINAFWNTVAPGYDAHPGNVPTGDSEEYAAWIDALRAVLPPAPADVLDVATGTGFAALIAAALGHRVTGIDAATGMLGEARQQATRRGLAITFVEGDAVAPALPEGSFDAIVSRHFIWTLREPERALENWRCLLRPGGRAIAIDSFWASAEPEEDNGSASDLFGQHYTEQTQAALPAMKWSSVEPIAAMFEHAGFVDVVVGRLTEVHALAKNPPGTEPWYVVTAYRRADEDAG